MMSNRSIHDRLEAQLKTMHNKSFMCNTHVERVLTWKYEDDQVFVETSRRLINGTEHEMLKRLTSQEFLETEEEADYVNQNTDINPSVEQLVSIPKLKSLEVCDNFMDALTRAMDEVEHNAGFKEQAQVMTNIAGKAIDYAKVQLDALRLARDIVRNRD
ncbi:hypothetical protein [Spirosoma agri]|uniref:Uncharacterized protein n=1 Tax=Spirosoma agri TaxID=1987381 RepID=A0A6M0II87_9BACT|nr:hypothetical protein [Spirosoma agri]NEU67959.1 hypothetical protein [Spirosoma agri]